MAIVLPGTAPGRYSANDLHHAGEDARRLVAESPVIRACISIDILSRQLYMLARSVMDNEIREGWEVDNGELVVQTLVLSAQEKANSEVNPAEVRTQLLETAIPFLNILVQAHTENAPPPVAETNVESSPAADV